eukprot:CAMPEP_0197389336 /NCGR_PEP_ID=MMETSP1165-20131217/1638_1 /TAXON_ID=284809 /ORGANISM="Chrysocystis fragilis, Strain CCMP3189" /LENGTH=80 /DNA_ID=CAMNT_0042914743 /DNA_START=290 /DNA_END=529 /DNA_ORIENTATION=-
MNENDELQVTEMRISQEYARNPVCLEASRFLESPRTSKIHMLKDIARQVQGGEVYESTERLQVTGKSDAVPQDERLELAQ